jgi:pyruvyltransferase
VLIYGRLHFINELASCDYILSSSLHGLILSDAYGIPNKWISISNNLSGREFKFKDYYSTTAHPQETCDYLKDNSDLQVLIQCISSHASIKKYMGDLRKL